MFRYFKNLMTNWNTSYSEYRWFIRLLIILITVIFILILGTAIAVYLVEHHGDGSMVIHSVMDGIWWAIVTFA